MTNSNKNLDLWNRVQKTNPEYTKPFTGDGGYSGTAINGTSVILEATKAWGPIGLNWGFKILEERIDNGAVVYDDEKEILGHTMTNTVHLELWVKKKLLDPDWKPEGDEDPLARVDHFGHTPYITWIKKWSAWKTDSEATKKSMTDAMKKCLSLYGFNADIFLGLYDDVSYVGMVKAELEVEKSDDQLATHIKQKQEYDEWYLKHYKIIETAVNKNELELVFKTCYRKMQRADDREGLLKMTRAKDKRLKQLEEKANGSTIQTDEGHEGSGETGGSGSGHAGISDGHTGSDRGRVSGEGSGDSNDLFEHGTADDSADRRGDKKAPGPKKAVRKSTRKPS